ncbi:hypothetical protein B0H19DRAFT_1279324 [Mycena capillaripes]|nr:hypothetical protein B0H19DRAFT_1279324 [Mycena capillaripes]
MDYRCIWYEKPLLESGTSGTKGNVQVILPHATESYGSSWDPEDPPITPDAFLKPPNTIELTIKVHKLLLIQPGFTLSINALSGVFRNSMITSSTQLSY